MSEENTIDLCAYKEGQAFEPRGVVISELISQNADFLVFLTDQGRLEWYHHDVELPDNCDEIMGRIGRLEAAANVLLRRQGVCQALKRELGRAVAACLDNAPDSVEAVLDEAELRLGEAGRFWYRLGSFVAMVALAGAALLLWIFRDPVQAQVGRRAFEVLLACGPGGIGAFGSVAVGSRVLGEAIRHTEWSNAVSGAWRVALGGLA